MRTLLCAIPALLALAGPALAEPQQLDEAQLGGIAAGQEAPGFNLSTSQLNTTSNTSNTTSTFEQVLNQSLGSMSTNTVYATGVNSSNVGATGSALTNVTGAIAP
jgi:flagellar hook-basal body complex protein FliE